jgi:hypothetical protein
MGKYRLWSFHELRETRMSCTQKSPNHSREHKHEYGITKAGVPGEPVTLKLTRQPSAGNRDQ